jgi:predicted NBD/HSP70 family sugar kinase
VSQPNELDGLAPAVAEGISACFGAVRGSMARTRVEIASHTGMSRAIVTERVRVLTELGLLVESGELTSTGGRPAIGLRVGGDSGVVLAVEIAMTHVFVAVSDIAGAFIDEERVDIPMADGPAIVLAAAETLMESLLKRAAGPAPLVGIGVGVAGPVEFASGRTIHPPVHPDWHDQPIRDRFATKFGVPVWVDNEVNLMALAELEIGSAHGESDVLVFKIGSWVGAGLVSNGHLHRGARGSAGSLETSAGGDDIAQQAELLVLSGQSRGLTEAVNAGQEITARLVFELASAGDEACLQLLDSAAEDIGRVMAVMTDFFNPSLIVVSGGIAISGDAFLARIREVVYGRALALATRDLRIVRSELGYRAVAHGAVAVTVQQLFRPDQLDQTLARVTNARIVSESNRP